MSIEIPEKLFEPLPNEEILKSLNFKKNQIGCYEKQIDILKVSACEWFGGWAYTAYFNTGRTAAMQEFNVISEDIATIDILTTLYKIWFDAFGKKVAEDRTPTELYYGKIHFEYKKNIQKLLPPKPTIWADREFFRFCISYIDKHIDWSENDYEIRFSKFEDQLCLTAKDIVLYCPARGQWLDTMSVSARHMYRSVPKRFLGDIVIISADPESITIDSHLIEARYIDFKTKT